MATITVELTREDMQRLKEMASKFGLSIEQLARIGIEDMLAEPDNQFQEVMQYVLKKNAELYKRLAA